ncbi:MAG TPA: C39 family peptidase [Chloroflexota bacterium]|nr:C39 family peptidase [Chloroflexota bacterium]
MLAWLLLVSALTLGPGDAHVLNVPYRSQLDGSAYALSNCGPASLSMVLAFYGIDAALGDLRVRAMQAQHSWIDDDGGYSDDYGVFVYNLASVADGMGLRSTGLWTREGARVDSLHEWEPADLRQEIDADHPMIVEVTYRALPSHAGSRALDDHYIVVHGTLGTDFVYSDPLGFGGGGPDEVISERDLAFAMGEASTPRAGFAVRPA